MRTDNAPRRSSMSVRGATPAQPVGPARWLLTHFTGRCWLGVELLRQHDDEMWLHKLREAGPTKSQKDGGMRRRSLLAGGGPAA